MTMRAVSTSIRDRTVPALLVAIKPIIALRWPEFTWRWRNAPVVVLESRHGDSVCC